MVRAKQSGGHQRSIIVRAEVIDIAKGGDGVARSLTADGPGTIFVPRTAVGDTIDVEIASVGNPARGVMRALVTASVDRQEPPCPHADACGGCDLMHLSLEAQQRTREAVVRRALEQAGFELPALERHPATEHEGYRTRVRLAAKASRGRITVGYRATRSHGIVEVQRCLVLDPGLDNARASLVDWLRGSEGTGEISLMQGTSGPCLSVQWKGELAPHAFAFAEAQVDGGHWSGMTVTIEGSRAPAVVGDATAATMGADGQVLVTPAGGFTQAHSKMNIALVMRATTLARCEGRPTLELFSGSGNFSVVLARQTDHLETVEEDEQAVRCARTNLAARGLTAKLRVHDANEVGARPAHRVALLDPPRAGAAGASRALARSKVRRVVMVSCDPATLARDASILRDDGGFALTAVELFDMFPHTSHVETVVLFERDRGGRS